MKLIRPLYILAIALVAVSSLATQTFAQTASSAAACEAFTAAVEARGDATIVSGIQAEETDTVPLEMFPTPDSNLGFIINIQTVAFETPQLTLPSGTLTIVDPDEANPVFGEGDQFSLLQVDINGNSTDAFFGPSGLRGPDARFAFTPDPALGNAFGFCLTTSFEGLDEFVVSVFDGDTLIGELSNDNFNFIAEPGETITRVEFRGVFIQDLLVAFGPNPAPPTELTNQECFEAIAVEVGALADAATDAYDAYALNVASAALHFSAKDAFYEEDGNRLSRRGANVFTGAAYAICYLEHTGVEGTEDIVDRIVEKLELIVDDEIDYAIANGGTPKFIERAEDLAEAAQWIDEELDNPFVATIAYKLAWANAYFSTY